MPLDTETIDFDAEQERLRDQMEEVAEKQADWASGEDSELAEQRAQQLLTQGHQLNNRVNIFDWAREEWGVESVALGGLTAGEVNRVEDTVENNPGVRERDAWVAAGTLEAPYVEHDPEEITQEDFEATVAAVTDLPLPWVQWAEEKITELSHMGEAEGNGYLELVRDKQMTES